MKIFKMLSKNFSSKKFLSLKVYRQHFNNSSLSKKHSQTESRANFILSHKTNLEQRFVLLFFSFDLRYRLDTSQHHQDSTSGGTLIFCVSFRTDILIQLIS